MTGFFDGMIFETAEQTAARAQAAFEAAEGDRRTLAELLAARGQRHAAAVVALSTFDAVQVDNWDGGQYEVHMSVPVALYDRVVGELEKQVSAAAEVVIGAGHYAGLDIGIRRADYRDGWEREFIERLSRAMRSERAADDVPALPAAN